MNLFLIQIVFQYLTLQRLIIINIDQHTSHVSQTVLSSFYVQATLFPSHFKHSRQPSHQNYTTRISFYEFQQYGSKTFFDHGFFSNKQHQSLFKLFLQFICNPSYKQLPFYYIQQNVREQVQDYLRRRDAKIRINNFKVLSSSMVEKMNIRGAFIHRKYNLNEKSYNNTSNESTITYKMKNCLTSQALKMYEKAIRAYLSQDMQRIYYKRYEQFIQEGIVTRYLYKIVTILSLQVQEKGKVVIVGSQQPCEHLLQVQSIVNKYSNLQEFYLTDIDFALKGNHHFRQRPY